MRTTAQRQWVWQRQPHGRLSSARTSHPHKRRQRGAPVPLGLLLAAPLRGVGRIAPPAASRCTLSAAAAVLPPAARSPMTATTKQPTGAIW